MIKLIYVTGYNSFTNKQLYRTFIVPSEALQFANGLTDPKSEVITADSYIKAFNEVLIKHIK